MKNRSPNIQSAVDVNARRTPPVTTPGTPTLVAAAVVTPQQRQRMIAEAAYFRAEQRGFGAIGECEDWLLAEAEIDEAIRSGTLLASLGQSQAMANQAEAIDRVPANDPAHGKRRDGRTATN